MRLRAAPMYLNLTHNECATSHASTPRALDCPSLPSQRRHASSLPLTQAQKPLKTWTPRQCDKGCGEVALFALTPPRRCHAYKSAAPPEGAARSHAPAGGSCSFFTASGAVAAAPPALRHVARLEGAEVVQAWRRARRQVGRRGGRQLGRRRKVHLLACAMQWRASS